MLHPSHTWATWPIQACELPAVHCRDEPQQHMGDKGTQEHFVGHTGTFCGAGSNAGRVSQLLHSSELSRSQQTHRYTEKPKQGMICEMSALQETDIWQEEKYPPRQKKTCHSEALLCRDVILAICSSAHGCLPVPNWGAQHAEPIIWVWHSWPCCSPVWFTQFRHSQARFWWQLQS